MVVLAALALARFAFLDAGPTSAPVSAPPRTAEEATARLEQATNARPDDLRAWQALGAAYVQRGGQRGDPADYDLARRAFDRADALIPQHPQTTLGRAALAVSLHDFDEALRLGKEVHAFNSFDSTALAVMVDAEVELGRYDDAVAHLQRMLDVRPALAALSRTSYLRELHGDGDGAVRAMQQAEQAGGQPADVAVVAALLGDLHLAHGELAPAQAAYERAERLSPGLAAAGVGRARVLAAQGRRAQAIDELQAVVNRFPQPAAVVLLSELQALEGRTAEAAQTEELVRVIARLQQAAGSTTDLELALFEADQQDDPSLAVSLAREAYDARPGNVYTADALAWALQRAGESQAAVTYMEQALRLGTTDPLVRFHAAEVFVGAGDSQRGRAELRKALDANPWFSFRHHDRARALAQRLALPTPPEWGQT